MNVRLIRRISFLLGIFLLASGLMEQGNAAVKENDQEESQINQGDTAEAEEKKDQISEIGMSSLILYPSLSADKKLYQIDNETVYAIYPDMLGPDEADVAYVKRETSQFEQIFIRGKSNKEQVMSLLCNGGKIDHAGFREEYLAGESDELVEALTQQALLSLVDSEYQNKIKAGIEEGKTKYSAYYYALIEAGTAGNAYEPQVTLVGATFTLDYEKESNLYLTGVLHFKGSYNGMVEFIDLPEEIVVLDEQGNERSNTLFVGEYFRIGTTVGGQSLLDLQYQYQYHDITIHYYEPFEESDQAKYTPLIQVEENGYWQTKTYQQAFAINSVESMEENDTLGSRSEKSIRERNLIEGKEEDNDEASESETGTTTDDQEYSKTEKATQAADDSTVGWDQTGEEETIDPNLDTTTESEETDILLEEEIEEKNAQVSDEHTEWKQKFRTIAAILIMIALVGYHFYRKRRH